MRGRGKGKGNILFVLLGRNKKHPSHSTEQVVVVEYRQF